MMSDGYLTTGQAAQLGAVNFRTVIRWIEKGWLPAHRLPGRGDHRIAVAEFVQFLKSHGMPVPASLEPVNPRLLIVEDLPEMAAAIERIAVLAGLECAIARDGFEAGARLLSFRPRLMTLDLKMPGMDGFGVLDYLQQHPPPFDVRVLVISADSEARLAEAGRRGADAVLAKPFRAEELEAQLRRFYPHLQRGFLPA